MESEKLNLKKAKKILDNLFKDFDWLDVTIEMKDNTLICQAVVTAKVYKDDDIYVAMIFWEEGRCLINFWFGYIDKNEETFDLINSFNCNVIYLNASINDSGLLRVSYSDFVSEDTVALTMMSVFYKLTDKDTVKYLKPLTDLTRQIK